MENQDSEPYLVLPLATSASAKVARRSAQLFLRETHDCPHVAKLRRSAKPNQSRVQPRGVCAGEIAI